MCTAMPGFFLEAGNAYSGPHACVMSTLFTEPLPQPLDASFLKNELPLVGEIENKVTLGKF